MKKTFLALLCLCMLLSGCRDASSQKEQMPPQVTETPPAASRLPLLEQGTVLEESDNLRYIPCEAVESLDAPQLRLLGNGLLLSAYSEGELVLRHISLEDGALVAEGSVPAKPGAKLYIGSEQIGLCDRESGLISILDEGFGLLRTYAVSAEGEAWYLNSELDRLYIFFPDRGLRMRNLETGEEMWLVDNGFRVTPIGSGTGYVIFSYTDRQDQKTYTRCLNLSAVTLETLPVSEPVTGGIRQGETWLLRIGTGDGFHMLTQNESAHGFSWTDSEVQLLSQRRHLLMTDPSGRDLTLYESDGTFLSHCTLPRNSGAVVGSDFVWSGYWEGYFFADFMDSTWHLMFWDVGADREGENLALWPLEQTRKSEPVVEQQLYERAEQLSRRFGLDIRIAEQCTLDYSHYDTYALTDPVFIRSALDVLEESLSRYPEGFFRQLLYGSIESIRIELVGGLCAKENVDTHPTSIGAFAQNRGSYYSIVLDGFLIRQQTLFHEFSHIIDARLEWDALLREGALYSEEAWLALQPEGFQYALSYTEIPEEVLAYLESGYFLNEYSLTFPTEDRAVLMETAMSNHSWDFEPDTGRSRKLQYYADCIRDCFDTTGWPETTLWEQTLK